ncbi:MAG: hypothetical protein ABEH66_02835 [Halobacteriales archaeon]
MRYKIVPEPRDLDELRAIKDAVPLVPGTAEDCCSRIVTRAPVAGRDAAREWLTFLQALGLVADSDRGFHRTRDGPDRAALRERFLDGVFGAREVRHVLAEESPAAPDAVFASLREAIPGWERHRRADWEAEWRERTARLLDWGVVLGAFEETDDSKYRIATGGS